MLTIPGIDGEFQTFSDLWEYAAFSGDDIMFYYVQIFEPYICRYIRNNQFQLLATLPEYRMGLSNEYWDHAKIEWEVEKGYRQRAKRSQDWDELTVRQRHLRINARRIALIEDYDKQINQVLAQEIDLALKGDAQARKEVISWTKESTSSCDNTSVSNGDNNLVLD